jgi:hypothetical protein
MGTRPRSTTQETIEQPPQPQRSHNPDSAAVDKSVPRVIGSVQTDGEHVGNGLNSAPDGQNNSPSTYDNQARQSSFSLNNDRNYYLTNGNVNLHALYWSHYYPGHEMYPAQAGILFPSPSSCFVPQPQRETFNFFTPSYQPPPIEYQQHPPRTKALFTPNRSGTLPISPDQQRPISIPEPSADYILNASLPPSSTPEPTPKLLILDLNGTLLHRPRNRSRERTADMRKASQHPILRPYLPEFMDYIFAHFVVMFWSSAKPHNVEAMINATTTPEQRKKIIAVWDRGRFGLTKSEYDAKSVTIKNLELVFASKAVGGKRRKWDASNTVLVDDSVVKAAYQPYNHVCVPEFVGEESGHEVLREITGYLEELRYQTHVARFIKQNPFRMGDAWSVPALGNKVAA